MPGRVRIGRGLQRTLRGQSVAWLEGLVAERSPVRGGLIYIALAAGGLWYGAKGLYAGLVKFQAGGYTGDPRDLVIDILTVLIQLGIGIGLLALFVRALRQTETPPAGPPR